VTREVLVLLGARMYMKQLIAAYNNQSFDGLTDASQKLNRLFDTLDMSEIVTYNNMKFACSSSN
jgi:hypothetical protein